MTRTSTKLKILIILLGSVVLVFVAAAAYLIDFTNIPPRQLAPYLERRAAGHNPGIEQAASTLHQALLQLDRGTPAPHRLQTWTVGAQPEGGDRPPSSVVMVANVSQLRQALATAHPGQVISLLPGHYVINDDNILNLNQPGSADAPIILRADQPGKVVIELNTGEGFKVSAPYWTIENLTIQGICPQQEFCEHAFHVVGRGAHFTARNNTITDFNAHFKINGEDGFFPDFGVITGNTLTNSQARHTTNPVTPIDLVAASHWRIAHNIISDFIKTDGDRISYGAFVKGGGSDNHLEQNIIVCEYMLRDNVGQQVGLSLGGGGTGPEYCRDKHCITEQDGSVIQANLISSCSDDGIYLNSAASSKILHNTLVDTGGITVRFPASSADVEGNLVDSVVRTRDDGILRTAENEITGAINLYLGRHPVRHLFNAPEVLDFSWREKPPVRKNIEDSIPDLCQGMRNKEISYGAFEDFSPCLKKQKN